MPRSNARAILLVILNTHLKRRRFICGLKASNTIITESPVRSFEKPRPPSSSIISLSSLHKIRINNFLMAAGVVAGDTAAQVEINEPRLDIAIEKIRNSGDKILTLAVVDNGHGMGHVSSVDNIVYLRIYGLVLDIDCPYAFSIDVRMLVQLAHLDCGGSHGVCVPFNFAKSGRMAESENWSPQQPPQAHTGHGLTQAKFSTSMLKCRIDT
ncbi:hypothetical protein Tco_0725271 [Tanacetum coccineum]|uniref:Uncharacterized protein n=1 Tax=Tanacetum coccineum TaxID=301880 RepID=A0ABQ4YCF3_9ASTR